MSDPTRKTITLCMIVKNEKTEHLIECFESVKDKIDYWVVCDNGSTDGTQEYVREYWEKQGIPGELIEVPWEGFGKTRTRALRECDGKADYAWMIDADDYLVGDFQFPHELPMDAYSLRIKRGNFEWWRNQIFKTGVGWEYTGVLHEYAHNPKLGDTVKQARLQNPDYHIEARTLGARNITSATDKTHIDAKTKYLRDADILTSALTNPEDPAYEPKNERYHFYLGQSYFDAQEFKPAMEWYEKRAELGGWEEEVFYSWYRVAMCASLTEEAWPTVCQMFLRAWEYRPTRIEPLYQIARIYRLSGHPRLAYMFAKQALDIPFPQGDILFIPTEMYDWQLLDELASTAFYVGAFQEGYDACMKLLQDNKFPESERQRIMTNLEQYQLGMEEQNRRIQEQQAHFEAQQKEISELQEKDREERIEAQKVKVAQKRKRDNKRKKQQAAKSRKRQRT